MVLGIFKIALCLSVWHVFMWQLLEILNVFNTLTLKQIFLKTKNFFKKLEEANVKTNRMGGGIQNGPIAENRVCPVTTLFIYLLFFCFFRIFYEDLIWCTSYPDFHIHTFRKYWSFTSGSFFPVSILKCL